MNNKYINELNFEIDFVRDLDDEFMQQAILTTNLLKA